MAGSNAGTAQRPRAYQREAIRAALSELKQSRRAQLHMACGTGKTLVAMLVVRRRSPRTVVVFVPSLLLAQQFLRMAREALSRDTSYLAVCSDLDQDEARGSVNDFDCPYTTDRRKVRAFIRARQKCVVICTYQSSHVLAGMSFDFALFDEAHRTAGVRGKPFAFALDDANVRFDRRLFMTATPRHVDVAEFGPGHVVYSMDDTELYGHVCYSLPLRRAIELGAVCDYRIVVSVSRRRGAVPVDAVQMALRRAMQRYRTKKVFTFHHTIKSASEFVVDTKRTTRGVELFHVNGEQPAHVRQETLNSFNRADTAVVSNARCLSEGIDLPSVDMVAFLARRRSLVDITQAVGRAIRRDHNKTYGYVFLPLFVAVHRGEKVEDAVNRTGFKYVYEVLQALREQDRLLYDNLKANEASEPEDASLPTAVKIDVIGARGLPVEALRKAITVRLLRPFRTSLVELQQALLKRAAAGLSRPKITSRIALERAMAKLLKRQAGAYTHELTGRFSRSFNMRGQLYMRELFDRLKSLAPKWFENSADIKRAALLEMARSRRPLTKKWRAHLHGYTHKRSGTYNAEFDHAVRSLAPAWFVPAIERRKQQMIELANTGARRPSVTAKDKETRSLAVALCNIITNYGIKDRRRRHGTFMRTIRRVAPHWLDSDKLWALRKRDVLAQAERGASRPYSGEMAHTISMCTGGGHKLDKAFERKLHRLVPNWFMLAKHRRVLAKKVAILARAKSGANKPREWSLQRKYNQPSKAEHLMASDLRRFIGTYSTMYDAAFAAKVRRSAPHWFARRGEESRAALLKLARSGVPRPTHLLPGGKRNPRYTLLSNLRSPSSSAYDPRFIRTLKAVAPHWF